MSTLYTRSFNRLCDAEFFLPLEGEEPSAFERHLRFVYAAHSLLRTIRKGYHPSHIKRQVPYEMGERIDIDVWYPRKGTPAVLTTEVVCAPLTRAIIRDFEGDELYRKMSRAANNPIQGLAITLESANGEMIDEFNRLCQVYDCGCNDPNWKSLMPRFLLTPLA